MNNRFCKKGRVQVQRKLEILRMLESHEITVEEALELIEALDQTEHIDSQYEELSSEQGYLDNLDETKTYKRIEASLVSCKLNIEKSGVDDITIEILDAQSRTLIPKPDWLYFSEEDDTIFIKEKRASGIQDIFELIKNGAQMMKSNVFINIKLPVDMIIKYAKISSVSGNLSMIGVQAIDTTFQSVSGNIQLIQVKARHISAKATAGNIVVDDVDVGTGRYRSISGKIKISGCHDHIDFKNVSGFVQIDDADDIKVVSGQNLSGKTELYLKSPEKYNMAIESTTGRIDMSGFARVEKHNTGRQSVIIENQSKGHQLTIKSLSGKITIDQYNLK